MKREESIRLLKAASLMLLGKDNQPVSDLYYAMLDAIDALEEQKWIPIKMRPGTDEEYEDFCKYGDCPREDFRVFDCPTPDDDQEVFVTTRWGNVCIDIWHRDVDCCYFEDNCDDGDVIAWMPKPAAYKSEETES